MTIENQPPPGEPLKPPEEKKGKVELTDKIHTCPNCMAKFNDVGDIIELPELPAIQPKPGDLIPDEPPQKKSYLEELYG